MNLDLAPNILLEVTGAQTLRNLMNTYIINSIFLGTPRIACVSFPKEPANLEDLDKLVETIKEYNK
ncbi:MAG: hypothetical protein ACKPKO_64325 [Candidatus Fonsibacter sp.]